MKQLKLKKFEKEYDLLYFINNNSIEIQQICPIVYKSWIEYYQLFYYDKEQIKIDSYSR